MKNNSFKAIYLIPFLLLSLNGCLGLLHLLKHKHIHNQNVHHHHTPQNINHYHNHNRDNNDHHHHHRDRDNHDHHHQNEDYDDSHEDDDHHHHHNEDNHNHHHNSCAHHHHYDFLNNSKIKVLIQSVNSGKYLYATDWNVTQNHQGTLFNLVLVNAHERIYEIKRVCDGKVLDIEGGSCEQGAKLIIYPRHGGKNQQFKIEQVNGFFVFKPMNSIHRNFVLDVEGISCENGAKIHQWGFHGGKNQLFRIIPRH
jgi:hypothetical protein